MSVYAYFALETLNGVIDSIPTADEPDLFAQVMVHLRKMVDSDAFTY